VAGSGCAIPNDGLSRLLTFSLGEAPPKALRLYDELGLLRPAAVDPESGYRYYDKAQLKRAWLVSGLRRLGMPLAQIRTVCDLEPEAAAHEVRLFWAQVVADVSARTPLATFLVDYLLGKGSAMSDAHSSMGIRYAARSDRGIVRASNEDVAYAGARLLAVADGSRGQLASAAAIDALKPLETATVPDGDLLGVLSEAVGRADLAVRHIAATSSDDVCTTLTAMLWSGAQLALVHIGDSRAYLVRGGESVQLTHDHTYVQSLVDAGQLSVDQAASHPQRALLIRALDGTGRWQPDLGLHQAAVGDRYVLCSDGLSAVVAPQTLRGAITAAEDPEQVVERLIALAYQDGAPDNIACVVADVVAV
jgi:serine/threonine protein phosphatase PrpC